jgi:ABC-type branched-subunit amino acid transport system substrate-binding protein
MASHLESACGIFRIALLLLCLNSLTAGATLDPSELRGERIYRDGLGASGKPVPLQMGGGDLVRARVVVVCAGCHGRDGRGRREGTVVPSDIRWETLTNANPASSSGTRIRSGYTPRTFGRAVTLGLDPDGARLSPVMPRFQLEASDLADLLAYIKRLGLLPDPGIAAKSLRIGVILPPTSAAPELGQGIARMLEEYFGGLNQLGGIHQRSIEVRSLTLPSDPQAVSKAVEEYIRQEAPFAMVGSTLTGDSEGAVHEIFGAGEIPVVGAMSPGGASRLDSNRSPYYLFPGLLEQAIGLLAFSDPPDRRSESQVVLVDPDDRAGAELKSAIRKAAEEMGFASVIALAGRPSTDGLVRAMAQAKGVSRRTLLLLRLSSDDGHWLRELRSKFTDLRVLLPAEAADRTVYASPLPGSGFVYLSFPLLGSDQSAGGLSEYRALSDRLGLLESNRGIQMAVLSAARLLTEALRRSGLDLSRERLAETLQNLSNFDTGLCRPLSFPGGRRIGTAGIHVVEVDFAGEAMRSLGWFPIY